MSIYIGLGSNIGDRLINIKNAIHEIKCLEYVKLERISSLYHTEPIGVIDQDWFYNAVIEVKTEIDPFEMLNTLQAIEQKLKKDKQYRWGPRRIDLDLLDFKNLIVHSDRLILPHPLMSSRKFVLVPLSEVAPCYVHPVLSVTVWNMLRHCPDSQVIRIREKL